jgi:hypothetical protein
VGSFRLVVRRLQHIDHICVNMLEVIFDWLCEDLCGIIGRSHVDSTESHRGLTDIFDDSTSAVWKLTGDCQMNTCRLCAQGLRA